MVAYRKVRGRRRLGQAGAAVADTGSNRRASQMHRQDMKLSRLDAGIFLISFAFLLRRCYRTDSRIGSRCRGMITRASGAAARISSAKDDTHSSRYAVAAPYGTRKLSAWVGITTLG